MQIFSLRLWLVLFIVFVYRRLFHTQLPYFIPSISCTIDFMLSQDHTAGKSNGERHIEFVQDIAEEQWSRKGLFRTCYLKSLHMPTCMRKGMILFFISNLHPQAQLSISSQLTLWWEHVHLASRLKDYKGSFGYVRIQLCSFARNAHRRERERQRTVRRSRHRRVSGVRLILVWPRAFRGREMGGMTPLSPKVLILCFVDNIRVCPKVTLIIHWFFLFCFVF